jgi:hypothetical protein
MTKALVCIKCIDVRMLRETPVSCECGNVDGVWLDSAKGTCRITATDLSHAAVMGLNNTFFTSGLRAIRDHRDRGDRMWRSLHHLAGECPGYYFDVGRRDCWVILISSDDPASGIEWVERARLAAASEPE